MALGTLLKPALAGLAPRHFLYRAAADGTPAVALTFDDGPDARHTPALLEVLEREGARATFFLQGSNVEKHPALVRAIHAAGHDLGNHNYSHRRPGEIGTAAYVAEAARTQSLLEDCVGARVPGLFRPPYGTMSVPTVVRLARSGFRIVHWSVDSNDSFVGDAGELAAGFARLPVRPGDILLFHDDQAQTIAAMPGIVRGLKARGLGFRPVSALWPARP